MKSEDLKARVGIILRSFSVFFASSLIYLVVRGLVESSIYGDVEPSEFLEQWQYGEVAIKWFLTVGGICIFVTLFYTLVFGIRQKANFKIVVPAVLIVVLLLEVFFFRHNW
jgi:hypothetical protein